MEEKQIYRLDDEVSFRFCSLSEGEHIEYGDCTNFNVKEENWKDIYSCNQEGIHFHCTKHPEVELEYSETSFGDFCLTCPRCKNEIEIGTIQKLRSRCLRAYNRKIFKGAKLIRLDDWYVHELTNKIKSDPNYWITTNVKTDKDGDTIIVLYVGLKDSNEKAQYFIKPEKLQLTNDHKDMDPAKIISKIEVTLKDRTLLQKYDELF